MGKPLPDSIYLEQTGPRMGLKLLRGPDPRFVLSPELLALFTDSAYCRAVLTIPR